jgi:hypothetical protein
MHTLLVQSGWTYFGGNQYALDNSKAKIENTQLVLNTHSYKYWSTTENFSFEIFYIDAERDVSSINQKCLK